MERKILTVRKLKMRDEGNGGFSGYPSVFGHLDDGGDIVLPGAYAETLDEFLRRGFTAHSHDWSMSGVIGYPVAAREDDYGLYCESRFHSTPDAQAVRTKIRERNAAGLDVLLSIGYDAFDVRILTPNQYEEELPKYVTPETLREALEKCRRFSKIRLLPKLKLYEYSVVTVPMLATAEMTGVKGATGVMDLPLAARSRAWDATAAEDRVRAWAGAQEKPNAKYRRAFFWYDEGAPENFGSYKLQFADVVDGELHAVPRAIFACAGGHGVDAADIPDADKEKVRAKISAYYARMRKEFEDESLVAPWEKESSAFAEFKATYMGAMAEADACYAALNVLINSFRWNVLEPALFDKGQPLEERMTRMEAGLQEFQGLCMQIAGSMMAMVGDLTEDRMREMGMKAADGLANLPFGTHTEALGTALSAYLTRVSWERERRQEHGRPISHAEKVAGLAARFKEASERLQAMAAQEPDAPGKADAESVQRALASFQAIRARLAGVPL